MSQVKINKPKEYLDYKKLVPPSLAAYGGRFIVRGAKTETLEGTWNPERLVVLEFPSKERARQWWASTEYAAAKKLRQATADSHMLLVEGYDGVSS